MIELRCAPADGRPTLVRIGSGILGDGVLAAAGQRFPGRRTFVVADRSVSAATGCVGAAAGHAGATILVDGGEPLKSFGGVEDLLRRLVRAGADRSSVLVAVGGGSVGDAVRLAPALLLRGVDLLLAPRRLVAMVDSSVGGKTAINLPEGKNLVGAYWPGSEVWIDPGFLATLQLMAAQPVPGLIESYYVTPEATLYGDLIAPDGPAFNVPQGPGLGADPDPAIIEKPQIS